MPEKHLDQERIELVKQKELSNQLEYIGKLIESEQYIGVKDDLEDIIRDAKRYNLNIILNIAQDYYNFFKNPIKGNFKKRDIQSELVFIEISNYKQEKIEKLIKNYENIVKKLYKMQFLKREEENQLFKILSTLTKDISLSEVIFDQSIERLTKIKFPYNFQLTEKLSFLLEFFDLLKEIKKLNKEKNFNRIFYKFVYKLNSILNDIRIKYVHDFYFQLKGINFLLKVLIETIWMMLEDLDSYLEALPTPAGPYSKSKKEEIENEFLNDEIQPLLSKIQPKLYNDYIIINFSVLEWHGIEDRIYSIKKESFRVKQEKSNVLKVIKVIGKDIEIQVFDDPILNTILGVLNSTLGTIYVKITPDDFILDVTTSSLEVFIRFKFNIKNFHTFECLNEIEFEVEWEKIKPILHQIKFINEIEFRLKEIDNKNKEMKIRIIGENLDKYNIYTVKLKEIQNYIPQSIQDIDYTTEISLEPFDLLPIFYYSNLKGIEFNIYKSLTGKVKCSINATDPNCLMYAKVAEPEIRITKFKGFIQNSLKIKNLIFFQEIITNIKQLKIFLKNNYPLKLDIKLKDGSMIDYFIAPAIFKLHELFDTSTIFYNQKEK